MKLNKFFLLLLLLISSIIWVSKYYILFFSNSNKNITTKVESLVSDSRTNKNILDIRYQKLLWLPSKGLLTIRLWQVNKKLNYFKVWREKYYYGPYKKEYWQIVSEIEPLLSFWREFVIDSRKYKWKNYITYIWLSIDLRLTKKYIITLIWNKNWKIIDNNFVEINWRKEKIYYTDKTIFYKFPNLDVKVWNSLLLNNINSHKFIWTLVQIEYSKAESKIYVVTWSYKNLNKDLNSKIKTLKDLKEKYLGEYTLDKYLIKKYKKIKEEDKIKAIFLKYWDSDIIWLNIYRLLLKLKSLELEREQSLEKKYNSLLENQ